VKDGSLVFLFVQAHFPDKVVNSGIVGVALQRSGEFRGGVGVIAFAQENPTEVQVQLGVVVADRGGPLEELDSAVWSSLGEVGFADGFVSLVILGTYSDSLPVLGTCLFPAPPGAIGLAQLEMRGGVPDLRLIHHPAHLPPGPFVSFDREQCH